MWGPAEASLSTLNRPACMPASRSEPSILESSIGIPFDNASPSPKKKKLKKKDYFIGGETCDIVKTFMDCKPY